MNKTIFEPNLYYRWLHGRGEIYIVHGNEHTFVEAGQIFKGDFLNTADNIDELAFGCAINWSLVPYINNIFNEHRINEIINTLTLEECFNMLPNPADEDNINSYYPNITKHYIHNNGKWVLQINDWYGSKDQINIFEVHAENILDCLRSGIFMLVVRGMLPIDKLYEKFLINH